MTIRRTGLTGKSPLVMVAWAVVFSLAFPAPMATGQATGEGGCRFSDVPATSPAYADITYACRQGWFSGYPDGSFRPDRPVPAHQLATVVGRAFAAGSTRADMATFLRGGAPGDPAAPAGFADVPATHPQSEDIAYAVERSWFQGYPDKTFRPDRIITARQITTVLTRAFPTASTRAQLATFMRNGQQSLNAKNEPQPNPSTTKIAYTVPVYDSLGDQVASELWVADTDGSSKRRLTDDVVGWAWGWEWSPNGGRIAYSVIVRDFRGNEVGNELWAARADGSGARQLTDDVRGWSWSPDSTRIAYSMIVRDFRGYEAGGELWVAGADGSGARQLTDDVRGWSWSWSPDSARIVYSVVTERGSWGNIVGYDLWVAGADGSGARRLTHEISIHVQDWSPDGDMIAFTVTGSAVTGYDSLGSEVPKELWVASLDGSVIRRLTDDINIKDFINGVWWSPDGEWIVYEVKENSRDEEATSELWVVGVDGSGSRRLTEDFAYHWSWSPSGEWMAYQSRVWEFGRWLGYSLWVADADGSGAQQLADDIEDWWWSTNEEKIAYKAKIRDSRRTVLGTELWVADADGSGAQQLADDIEHRGWSPDGGNVVYCVDIKDSSDSRWELQVVGVNGSGARRLADDVGCWWAWAPGSERIAYDTVSGELWVTGVDGSGARQISEEFNRWEFEWSPGGERIAYLTGRELWVAGADGSGARKIADDVDDWEWQPEEG